MPSPQVVTSIYDDRVKVVFNPGRHTYSVEVPGVVTKQWFPSVTGILGLKAKPQLTRWAAKKAIEYVRTLLGTHESTLGAPPFKIDSKEMYTWLTLAEDGWSEDTATNIGSLVHRFFEAEVWHRAGKGPKPVLPILVDPVMAPDYTQEMVDSANSSINAGIAFLDDHKVEPIFLERPLFSPSEGYIGTCDFYGYIDGELAVLDYKSSKRLYEDYRIQTAAYTNAAYEEFKKLPLARYVIVAKKDGGLEWARYGVDTYQEDLNAFRACLELYKWERANDPYKKGSPVQPLGDLDMLVPRPVARP